MSSLLLKEYKKLVDEENKRMLGVKLVLTLDFPNKVKEFQKLLEREPDILISSSTFVERYERWYKYMHNYLEEIRLIYYNDSKEKVNERLIKTIEALNKKNDFINDYVKYDLSKKM